MPTCLITGANRGLGLEFTRQYLDDGWKVIAACRKPFEATELAALTGNIEIHALDVTDFARVETLGHTLERKPIDLLINNAGIYGPRSMTFDHVDYRTWADVLRANSMAPLKVAATFVDHVARSDQKKIVTITSNMGSIGDNTSGGSYIYRSSKAALNAVMKSLSIDLRSKSVIVAVLHPGWVQTDMGGSGATIDARTSITGMRSVIDKMTIEDSGRATAQFLTVGRGRAHVVGDLTGPHSP